MATGRQKSLPVPGLRRQPAETTIVGLDIGTVNVKALIARLLTDKFEVIGLGRSVQGLADMQSGAIADIPAVINNCSQALAAAESQAGRRPTQAVLGLAGDLIKGITNTSRVERTRPDQPLGIDEIDHIIKASQAQAEKQAKQEISLEVGAKSIDLKLINSALVGLVVDGYKVTNPLGFLGRHLEMQLYTAFAPLVHTGAIERVARDLGLNLVAVAAEPFAIARSVVGDSQNSGLNAILIDIGGGTTDIAILRDGGLEATRSFAIGGCSFSQAIGRDLEIPYGRAEALKMTFSTGDGPGLTATQSRVIKEALARTLDVWLAGVRMSLQEFHWLEYLPSRILLSGGGSLLSLLPRALSQQGWRRGLPFNRNLQISSIGPKDIPDLIDQTGQIADHMNMTGLGLIRVGLDAIGGDDYDYNAQVLFKRKLSQTLAN